MINDLPKGIYPAMVTPLGPDNEVSFRETEKLLAYLLGAGADGVYVAGSTGEGMCMTLPAREALVECIANSLPRGKKLLVHVGTAVVEDAIRLAKHAAKVGAHAVSSLPPRGSFAQVRDYYARLADSSPLPLILYYFPELRPEALRRPDEILQICALQNVIAIKFTDYDLFLMQQLSSSGTLVYNGRDEVLAAGLLMGASGGIGSTYNLLPELYVALYNQSLRGEWEKARVSQREINRVISILLKYPLIPAIKAGLGRIGLECGVAINGQCFVSQVQKLQFVSELEGILSKVYTAVGKNV